jgi:hypothetical protein
MPFKKIKGAKGNKSYELPPALGERLLSQHLNGGQVRYPDPKQAVLRSGRVLTA